MDLAKIVNIKTIKTDGMGQLSFFEGNLNVPFEIKRIYYISNVPSGVERGHHAHKSLKQLLFCPYGRIKMILDNGNTKETIVLDDPSVGILLERPIWREMIWEVDNSVLCVAASDYYSEEDYIRDYGVFLKYVNK